jgi:hypothetical protein
MTLRLFPLDDDCHDRRRAAKPTVCDGKRHTMNETKGKSKKQAPPKANASNPCVKSDTAAGQGEAALGFGALST